MVSRYWLCWNVALFHVYALRLDFLPKLGYFGTFAGEAVWVEEHPGQFGAPMQESHMHVYPIPMYLLWTSWYFNKVVPGLLSFQPPLENHLSKYCSF